MLIGVGQFTESGERLSVEALDSDALAAACETLPGGETLERLLNSSLAETVELETESDGQKVVTHAVAVPDLVFAGLDHAERRTLSLGDPGAPVPTVERRGVVNEADYDIEISWADNGVYLIGAKVDGTLLRAGKRTFVLSPKHFQITSAVQAFRRRYRSDRKLAIAKFESSMTEELLPNALKTFGSVRYLAAEEFTLSVDKDSQAIRMHLLRGDTPFGTERQDFSLLLSPEQERKMDAQIGSDHAIPQHFLIDSHSFVYLTDSLRPVLSVVHEMANGSFEERTRLLANPRAAVERKLRERAENGRLVLDEGGASPSVIELDNVLASLDHVFVETPEFLSDRVESFGTWEPKTCSFISPTKTAWFENEPDGKVAVVVGGECFVLSPDEIQTIVRATEAAKKNGDETIEIHGCDIDVNLIDTEALRTQLKKKDLAPAKDRLPKDDGEENAKDEPAQEKPGPQRYGPILKDNLETLQYNASLTDRAPFSHSLRGLTPPFKLYPHQEECLAWLEDLWNRGVPGALLADDMGLGKTIQCLSFLNWLREGFEQRGQKHPALVVAPVSLLNNWKNEGRKYFGQVLAEPKILDAKTINARLEKSSTELLNEVTDCDWVVTNYETIRNCSRFFIMVPWGLVVFDEAQKLKNPSTLLTESSKALKSEFTLMMTGTPVENSFTDLWSIMDGAVPGFMGSLKDFVKRYASPEVDIEEAGKELSAVLTGVNLEDEDPDDSASASGEKRSCVLQLMMRRLKGDRLKGLPRKTERKYAEVMPDRQAAAYREALEKHREGRLGALETLQRLSNCSLSPDNLAELYSISQQNIENSARLKAFFKILDQIAEAGEKAVIFVQRLEVQRVVATTIRERYRLNHMPGQINGSMRPEKRQTVVDRFQNGAPGFDALVLMGRAAGTGLTLTAANHVIHLERWWNPAVEDQCSDRVYRIGQKQDVTIHIPMALLGTNDDSSFDAKLENFLQAKRLRSQSVLVPTDGGEKDAKTLVRTVLRQ